MNPAIRMAVAVALARRHTPLGVTGGFAGLVAGELERLGVQDVEGISRVGGTILGTSSGAELATALGHARAVAALDAWRLDGLIVVGAEERLAEVLALARRSACRIVVVPCAADVAEGAGAAAPAARAVAQRRAFEAVLALEEGATGLMLGWDVDRDAGQPTEDPQVRRVPLERVLEHPLVPRRRRLGLVA
jgi:hypothetical protein